MIYTNKEKAISDLLKTCRNVEKLKKEKHVIKFRINKEIWTFYIYYKNNRISTKCLLEFEHNHNSKIFYPFTEWGGNYKRWDSDLKEFCEREFLKF
jgi:hypothetical protein